MHERVSIVGRSFPDIFRAWNALQNFWHGADLIVSSEPVRRAIDTPDRPPGSVFLVLSSVEDCEQVLEKAETLVNVAVVCPDELMQTCFAQPSDLQLSVLRLDDISEFSEKRKVPRSQS